MSHVEPIPQFALQLLLMSFLLTIYNLDMLFSQIQDKFSLAQEMPHLVLDLSQLLVNPIILLATENAHNVVLM